MTLVDKVLSQKFLVNFTNESVYFSVIEEDEGRTICFNCFGNATLSDRFQEDSYWKSGFISRYIVKSEHRCTTVLPGLM